MPAFSMATSASRFRSAKAGGPTCRWPVALSGSTAGGWRPDNALPEIAFAGRSNVGKSSLLNRLMRRKAFARVSRTPGRTMEVNFFRVNEDFLLVDLPGYGYAQVSKERKAEWRPLIEGYLRESPQLRVVVQLLDIRRDGDVTGNLVRAAGRQPSGFDQYSRLRSYLD